MSLRYFILLGCLICFVLQAAAQTGGGSAIVSVIINSESPEESVDAVNTTVALLNELDSRSLNASVFVTGDMAKAYPLYITLVGSKPNHELGLAGKSTDEDLGSVSASDMEVLLLRSKSDIESNYVCGGNSVEVKGFLPQPTTFESGEIPYAVLEGLDLGYFVDDADYVAQGSFWPYSLENSTLYIVPVSQSEDYMYLSDRNAKDEGLSADDWFGTLSTSFNNSASSGDPMVVVFHNYISGSGDYLEAYRKFVSFVASENATFVSTGGLVEMAKSRPSDESSA
jgi:hypothetical protein